MTAIRRLLVANRAEIASRVIRSARLRGIETVAVCSDADVELPYATEADVVVRLDGSTPSATYLRIDLLVQAARATSCDAVHPGYGFLSENADFAQACVDAGLVFVGPPAQVIASMGSKIEAKRLMAAAGVPILEGAEVAEGAEGVDDAALAELGARIGYPLLVKASYGGGGRGMRVVERDDQLASEVAAASREAASAFGNGTVFLERLVVAPRHVEIQILGDSHGSVTHLFERECSIQRRHQKLVEESPSPGISEATRSAMFDAAVAAGKAIGYVNAGTVEFIVDRDERFYFLEVNTRLQVEHPVTELVTRLDLVDLQLRVAEGARLGDVLPAPTTDGHAIEVRLYAEDPDDGFLPASGRLSAFEFDGATGVRVDAGYTTGSTVSTNYDAMLAKVIAWAPSREEAARRLAAALRRARIHGLTTNRDLLVGVLESREFLDGTTDTGFLDRHRPGELSLAARSDDEPLACVAAALWQRLSGRAPSPQPKGIPAAWRNVGPATQPWTFRLRGSTHDVLVTGRHGERRITLDGRDVAFSHVDVDAATVRGDFDGIAVSLELVRVDDTIYVDGSLGALALTIEPRLRAADVEEAPGSLHASLPGSVKSVAVSAGDEVDQGDVLVVLEAMKMEHAVRAPHRGVVEDVLVHDGDQVESGAVLVVVAPHVSAAP